MVRRGIALACALAAAAVVVQVAAADPTHAKNGTVITLLCGGQQVQVATNGNGEFTPGHDIGGTSIFVPTSFDLTFSFTPTGGTTESDTDTSAKQNNQHKGTITCSIPAALNTFTTPDGTFTISGSVTGFKTPANG